MAKTSRFPAVAFGVFFMLPGLGMLAGLYGVIVTGPDPDRMLKTEGEVIGVPGGTPRVVFVDNDGREHVVDGTVSSEPPSYEIGEKVGVLYDPARPDEAIIDSFLERYFVVLMLGGMGGLFTLIGGGTVLAAVRSRLAGGTRESTLSPQSTTTTTQIEQVDRSTLVHMIRMGAFEEAERYAQKEVGLDPKTSKRLVKEIRKQEGR